MGLGCPILSIVWILIKGHPKKMKVDYFYEMKLRSAV